METSDTEIILECMTFILKSNEIEDWEFHPRLGVDRPTLAAVIECFPSVDGEYDDEELCVNNCLNEVCHALHFSETQWREWFTFSKDEVREIYRRWSLQKGRNRGIL